MNFEKKNIYIASGNAKWVRWNGNELMEACSNLSRG